MHQCWLCDVRPTVRTRARPRGVEGGAQDTQLGDGDSSPTYKELGSTSHLMSLGMALP